MKISSAVNRAKLVDEPIVEMLLSRKYYQSGISFIKADLKSDYDGTDIIAYANGNMQSINVKRNSSKYYNSPNFSISVNKNKLNSYAKTLFVFIDEVADSLYIVNGINLLKYILSKVDSVCKSDKSNSYYIIIPKTDIVNIVSSDDDIIKYNKSIANLFAIGRDESTFMNLN